jgi:hypothetical protein
MFDGDLQVGMLNAAAAAAVGTTGVGLVVVALALLAQAKDAMAMYEVGTR